eukprot:SAG31_NODE_9134_length_1328_cov_1.441009_2_plen_164_part_00
MLSHGVWLAENRAAPLQQLHLHERQQLEPPISCPSGEVVVALDKRFSRRTASLDMRLFGGLDRVARPRPAAAAAGAGLAARIPLHAPFERAKVSPLSHQHTPGKLLIMLDVAFRISRSRPSDRVMLLDDAGCWLGAWHRCRGLTLIAVYARTVVPSHSLLTPY